MSKLGAAVSDVISRLGPGREVPIYYMNPAAFSEATLAAEKWAHPPLIGASRRTLKSFKRVLDEDYANTTALVPHSKPRRVLARDWLLQVPHRGILEHERWHAGVPVLGRSEILAHLYGGLHGSLRGERFGLKHQLKAMMQFQRRRAMSELRVAGGVGAAGGAAGVSAAALRRRRESS